MRRDIDRGDMFSSRDKDFCFRSGFCRTRSRTVLIAALVLTHLGRPDPRVPYNV